jgi:cell fate regulator YaaT (PSP1 superfamily)
MEPFIVGIRFQKVGKIYHFDASNARDLLIGDFAVVETSRGRQLGEVIQIVDKPSRPPEGTWKPIHHKATPRDLVLRQLWQKKELEAMINCRAKLAEAPVPGVKIVAAEFTFDGSRLAFLYSTEAEGKVDLRRLRNVMQRLYPRTHVEMRQIGPRDVAKILGGMGACGLENRCCSMFLTEFSPISIKMAKEQGISLTPSEITGMCGRLRCCLVYEYEQYVEARKDLPKRGKRVVTPQGEGKVVDVYPLKQVVVVELDSGVRVDLPHTSLEPWDELEVLRRKAQGPCDKHENGECDCGSPVPESSMSQDYGSETPAGEASADTSFDLGPDASLPSSEKKFHPSSKRHFHKGGRKRPRGG